MPYSLDVKQLLDDLGGPHKLRSDIAGVEGLSRTPEIEQMRKWVERSTIPTKWLLLLLVYAQHAKLKFDVLKYVQEGEGRL